MPEAKSWRSQCIVTSVKAETASSSPQTSSSPTALTIFWLEVLELAHAGDDAAITQRLASLQLRKEDLDEIFGVGAGNRLWGDYTRAFASFAGEGAGEIAKKIRERRYDDVEVLPLNGVRPEHLAPADRRTAEPLRTNLPVYTVRLKRAEESDGIRIDTFIFLDGAWRTALKVGCPS
jgi:hypothetical protein